MLPVAEINPAVNKLPLVVLPVTDSELSVPTEVKLENNTFELSVFPVSALAATPDAVTPVS